MSNALSIAAATLTLQHLLRSAVAGNNVTLKPPDAARGVGGGEQLNLFLYQTGLNPAWRNAEMPRPARGGEVGLPPLALNLHYLLTAYGDTEADSHRVLGRAMSLLHDHMVLSAAEIRNAVQADLPLSDLDRQPERLRVTPLALTTEEIFKLWSGFSTHYRLSVAYEVSVLLIESQRQAPTPLPVLTQGRDNRGPFAQAGRGPVLDGVRYQDDLPAATLGSVLEVTGQNLDPTWPVQVSGAGLSTPIPLLPTSGDSGSLRVTLPSGDRANRDWAAGFYALSVHQTLPGSGVTWASNAVPFSLAPTITVAPNSAAAGTLQLEVTCQPYLRAGARVTLLIAGQQISPDLPLPPPGTAGTLHFTVPNVTGNADGHPVRLRVDGVDSLPMRQQGGHLEFHPDQKVVVT